VSFCTDANYNCTHCQAQFVEKNNFDIHLKYSPACRDANPQAFKCGKCGEVFTTLINLQQHIRRHAKSYHSKPSTSIVNFPASESYINTKKPLQCQYCAKSFKYNYMLKYHVLTHTRKKIHQCQHCNKAFMEKSKLKIHLRTHTGEKPYKCQYCRRPFADHSNLRRHLRTHTGEKPYKCQYCSKAFSRSRTLQHHLATHTDVN